MFIQSSKQNPNYHEVQCSGSDKGNLDEYTVILYDSLVNGCEIDSVHHFSVVVLFGPTVF